MGMGYARGITAGVRLGVFEALREGAADAAELAERTACHPDGMRPLANTLAGFGLLRREEGRCSLTRPSRKWFLAVISDAAHPGGQDGVDATARWDELFFSVVSGASAWPEETMSGWMNDGGFSKVTCERLLSIPQVVITAIA
jgi:hypothetical protein